MCAIFCRILIYANSGAYTGFCDVVRSIRAKGGSKHALDLAVFDDKSTTASWKERESSQHHNSKDKYILEKWDLTKNVFVHKFKVLSLTSDSIHKQVPFYYKRR